MVVAGHGVSVVEWGERDNLYDTSQTYEHKRASVCVLLVQDFISARD